MTLDDLNSLCLNRRDIKPAPVKFNLNALIARFNEETAHWSDDELALCFGANEDFIRDLKTGCSLPSAYNLYQMADIGLDVQYILTGVRSANTYEVFAALTFGYEIAARYASGPEGV